MATVTGYSSLKAAIKEWTRRDGGTTLDSQIDMFIDSAEADFNLTVRHPNMEETDTLTTDANGEASLPDDFLEMRSVRRLGSPNIELEPISRSASNNLSPSDTASTPYYYSISESTIRITPIQDAAEILLTYYATITPLSDSATTNWLLALAPNAYLFQSLHYASLFTREFDAASGFEARAANILRDVGIVGDLAAYRNAGITLDFPTA